MTSSVGYVRIHGRAYKDWFRKAATRDERYDCCTRPRRLEPWIERTQSIASNPLVNETYVVTNNHLRGKATANALMIMSMLEKRSSPCPLELVHAYRSTLKVYARPRSFEADGEGLRARAV